MILFYQVRSYEHAGHWNCAQWWTE